MHSLVGHSQVQTSRAPCMLNRQMLSNRVLPASPWKHSSKLPFTSMLQLPTSQARLPISNLALPISSLTLPITKLPVSRLWVVAAASYLLLSSLVVQMPISMLLLGWPMKCPTLLESMCPELSSMPLRA